MDMPKYINYSEGILVAGLARNCENSIHRDVLKINKALANFTNISWLVIESDSEDSTLNSLKDLQRKVQGFDFYTFGRLQGKLPL